MPTIPAKATPVYADTTRRRKVGLVTGSALYYSKSPSVSPSSYEAKLEAVNDSVILPATTYFFSAGSSEVYIEDVSELTGADLATQSEVGTNASGIGRRLLRILTEGIQDASIVIVGDSTSAGYAGTWVGGFTEGVAKRFPAYTVKYRDWTDGGSDYNSAVTKQTGTGSKTLTVYNCAVASKTAYYQLAPYFDTMIASKQPDLVIFSHGHNHGGAGTAPGLWQEGLIVATQSILRACPNTDIVLIAQNPRADAAATVQAERQYTTERIAQLSGFGFVNVWKVFHDRDATAESLLIMPEGIHPNTAGYALQAETILNQLIPDGSLRPQSAATLNQLTPVNALSNGDFSSFASPPTLTSWTATNATLSKDETNFESSNGYSVKIATTTTGAAYILQTVSGNSVKRLKGEWLTFLVRLRVPGSQPSSSGQINLIETGGSNAGQNGSGTLTNGTEDWRWVMCQRRIAKDATSISLQIVASLAAQSGELSVDRAILIPGIWPRDLR